MSKLVEKTVESELVFKGRALRVQRDVVLCPDGKERFREYILHPGAALAVPVLEDGRFVMVRQYRHSLKEIFLEFPAGKLDPGEESSQAVKRELAEETGFEASSWKFLGQINPCIGYSNEFIDMYLATGLKNVGANPDEGEELEAVIVGFDELKGMIARGEVTDVKTLCAFFFYEKERS